MKKITFFLLSILSIIGSVNAQKSTLVGSWLMTKAETGNDVQNPYQITDFNDNGKFFIMGFEAGTWEYNKANNSILLKSELDKDFNGEGKIEKITTQELVITKEGTKMFYTKVNNSEIVAANKNSGLMGTWEFKDVPYSKSKMVVTFTEPDEFKMIQKEEGMTASFSGTWIFDKTNNALIMIGLRGEDTFHGKNKVITVNDKNLELENNGTVFKGEKKAQNTAKIERLTFTEDDFYTEDGDYKYEDDTEKLPWRNWSELKTNLLEVKQLVYNYASLVSGTQTFDTKTLISNVKATLEEEGFSIDNIFNGFDRFNLPEDSAFPENNNFTAPLYPLEDDTFRVTGNEEITTPAGTFDCTVVEVASDSGALKKLWLINDKIGVFAKIIEDNPDESWGHYWVYELQEIK